MFLVSHNCFVIQSTICGITKSKKRYHKFTKSSLISRIRVLYHIFDFMISQVLDEHVILDQLAKPTFRSRYAHTPFTEQSEGPMDTVASNVISQIDVLIHVPLWNHTKSLQLYYITKTNLRYQEIEIGFLPHIYAWTPIQVDYSHLLSEKICLF